jgi:hypothetical protein
VDFANSTGLDKECDVPQRITTFMAAITNWPLVPSLWHLPMANHVVQTGIVHDSTRRTGSSYKKLYRKTYNHGL